MREDRPIAAEEIHGERSAGSAAAAVATVGIPQRVSGATVRAVASLARQANARHRIGGADVGAEIAHDQRRERGESY